MTQRLGPPPPGPWVSHTFYTHAGSAKTSRDANPYCTGSSMTITHHGILPTSYVVNPVSFPVVWSMW
jgi:hypothetical protein